jgi:hypothetical protein
MSSSGPLGPRLGPFPSQLLASASRKWLLGMIFLVEDNHMAKNREHSMQEPYFGWKEKTWDMMEQKCNLKDAVKCWYSELWILSIQLAAKGFPSYSFELFGQTIWKDLGSFGHLVVLLVCTDSFCDNSPENWMHFKVGGNGCILYYETSHCRIEHLNLGH